MKQSTREDPGLPAASDHLWHRQMIAGVPVRREEQITHLRHVNAAVLSGTCRKRPSSGGSLKFRAD
jgi:hypothetical protein